MIVDLADLSAETQPWTAAQSPNENPREIGAAVWEPIEERLSLEKRMQLLSFANGGAPWLHLKNSHVMAEIDGPTPQTMISPINDRRWWPTASAVLGLLHMMKLHPVAFECENKGNLFVNLVRQPGEGRAAEYSSGLMDGHTDALPFPFPEEYIDGTTPPPAPDFVILAGVRNPERTPTFVSPLSGILAQLSTRDIAQLRQPKFLLNRQPSFDCPYIGVNKSVLGLHAAFGTVVRFSQSRVAAAEDDLEANMALQRLGEQMIAARIKACVERGDILFINNRLAMHGRDAVKATDDGNGRWLLRIYAYHPHTVNSLPNGPAFVMQCT